MRLLIVGTLNDQLGEATKRIYPLATSPSIDDPSLLDRDLVPIWEVTAGDVQICGSAWLTAPRLGLNALAQPFDQILR